MKKKNLIFLKNMFNVIKKIKTCFFFSDVLQHNMKYIATREQASFIGDNIYMFVLKLF